MQKHQVNTQSYSVHQWNGIGMDNYEEDVKNMGNLMVHLLHSLALQQLTWLQSYKRKRDGRMSRRRVAICTFESAVRAGMMHR